MRRVQETETPKFLTFFYFAQIYITKNRETKTQHRKHHYRQHETAQQKQNIHNLPTCDKAIVKVDIKCNKGSSVHQCISAKKSNSITSQAISNCFLMSSFNVQHTLYSKHACVENSEFQNAGGVRLLKWK
jgi:hypothetical protein